MSNNAAEGAIRPLALDQKIIRAKVGVLELAKQLGNVSQACKLPPRPAGRTASTGDTAV